MEKPEFLSHQRAGSINRNLILNYIKNNGPVTRMEIGEKLGLSKASMTQITKKLIEQGLIGNAGPVESNSGRKPTLLRFCAGARAIIVFDWHTKMLVLLNMDAHIMANKNISVRKSIDAEEFVELLKKEIDMFVDENKIKKNDVLGLGLIMPGIIDSDKGKVLLLNENNWKNIQLGGMFKRRTGFNTVLDSDGHMTIVGEYLYGSARGVDDFVLFELEAEGIGMTQFLKGGLYKGRNNFAGEIGHILFVNDGPLCKCGRKGCLEAVIMEALHKNNGKVTKEVVGYLGWAVSIVINIIDPEMIVFTGSILEAGGNVLLAEIKEDAMNKLIETEIRDIRFTCSSSSVQNRVRGMGNLIYSRFFCIADMNSG